MHHDPAGLGYIEEPGLVRVIRCLVLLSALLLPSAAFAQCAPGIPAAGNPGCIPPDQDNSPYGQSAPGPATLSAKWAELWGSVAVDYDMGRFGTVSQSASKASAEAQAMDRCVAAGGKSCRIGMTYHNQCVAMAQVRTGGRVHLFRGPYLGDTEKSALGECRRDGVGECHIAYSKCSYVKRVR